MENSPAVKNKESSPDVPGIGISGVVMCPMLKSPCLKGACEFWVELNYGEQRVGRCAHSWNAVLSVELRQEVERLRKVMEGPTKE